MPRHSPRPHISARLMLSGVLSMSTLGRTTNHPLSTASCAQARTTQCGGVGVSPWPSGLPAPPAVPASLCRRSPALRVPPAKDARSTSVRGPEWRSCRPTGTAVRRSRCGRANPSVRPCFMFQQCAAEHDAEHGLSVCLLRAFAGAAGASHKPPCWTRRTCRRLRLRRTETRSTHGSAVGSGAMRFLNWAGSGRWAGLKGSHDP